MSLPLYGIRTVLVILFSGLLAMNGLGAAFLFVPLSYHRRYARHQVSSFSASDGKLRASVIPCPGFTRPGPVASKDKSWRINQDGY
jgi:hypothetical protein